MFFNKKHQNKNKTEWLQGVLTAEKFIEENRTVEEIHLQIGSIKESILCDPRGLRLTFWQIPDTEFAKGVIDYLIHKGIKTLT